MKKIYKKTGSFLVLLSVGLPWVSFAQTASYYPTSPSSYYSVSYYPSYICGTGTVCGGKYPVSTQSAPHSQYVPSQSPVSQQYSQTASVVNAFPPANVVRISVPQLPKTGGGGKAMAAALQANSQSGSKTSGILFWVGIVSALILGSFFFLKKSPKNQLSVNL